MGFYENREGVVPWGDKNLEKWIQFDPGFHLDRIRAPLRIEMYAFGMGWWDVFATLRRHQRPAEYVSIPDGAHDLVKPWERLTSQEGDVDWFDFWLNGHEDSNPTKREQYVRWHQLREERDAAASDLVSR
jgi:hypothetical protein